MRGALVGCLALVKRKTNAGVITGVDAKMLAQSFLENLQVQSLGQHDRKVRWDKLPCVNIGISIIVGKVIFLLVALIRIFLFSRLSLLLLLQLCFELLECLLDRHPESLAALVCHLNCCTKPISGLPLVHSICIY